MNTGRVLALIYGTATKAHKADLGKLPDLTTEDKTNIVAAINELNNNPYSRIKKICPYLYEVWYDKLDYDEAYRWYETKEPIIPVSGCSSFRVGDMFARNFDWLYDETAEFIVHTKCKDGRYATLGVASALTGMTEELANSHAKSHLFYYVPFTIVDGCNEKGLHISTNVVPNEKGDNRHITPTGDELVKLCSAMLPRFVLDHFDSAQSAISWLSEHATIYPSQTLLDMDYLQHYLIADADDTYVIEFVDGELVAIPLTGNQVKGITNFYIDGVTFNNDGTVYTPYDSINSTHTASENGITDHGSGLERYNIMINGTSVWNITNSLRYTKAYSNIPVDDGSAEDIWFTEFVNGDRTVNSSLDEYGDALDIARNLYDTRSRNGQTWQTVHSSVYDMENLILQVQVQEEDETYEFDLRDQCSSGGCGCEGGYCAVFNTAYIGGCAALPFTDGSIKFTASTNGSNINFFKFSHQEEFPSSDLFEVYVNGTLRPMSLYSLTFSTNDQIEIKAKNSCAWFPVFWPGDDGTNEERDCIKSIDTPLPPLHLSKTRLTPGVGFYYDNEAFSEFIDVDYGMFSNCASLESVCDDLFINNTQIQSAAYTFYYCESLVDVGSVFSGCSNIIDFYECFYTCEALTTIPDTLFADCTNAMIFDSCFDDCDALTTIPDGLFASCINATSFYECFYGCDVLSNIPSGLFSNCVNALIFDDCFAYTAITSIPAQLFSSCTNAISFYSCFDSCYNLTSIPVGLFANNTDVETFEECFYDTSIESIPADLFNSCSNLTDVTNCFHGCSNLTTIPNDLFKNNSGIGKFYGCFEGCTSLTSIPEDLFANNTTASDFSRCFYGCSFTTIPEDLFTNNIYVTNFDSCFNSCQNLSELPTDLFVNQTSITSMNYCFSSCPSLGNFELILNATNIRSATNFVTKKSSATRIVDAPSGSTTLTTFNTIKTTLGLTINFH